MMEAFVLIKVVQSESNPDLDFMKSVERRIAEIKGVKEVNEVFGRWDFVVRVQTKTLLELGNLVADCIRSINGVLTTETLIIG